MIPSLMRVSKKTDYALRALFTLLEHQGGKPVPTRVLAQSNDIPKPFLEHILLELKAKGWVESTPGKAGGYFLAVNPEHITMGQVVRLFDSLLAPIDCVSKAHYQPCSQENRCRFRRVFLNVRNLTARIMDDLSLAAVYRWAPVVPKELDDEILHDGAGI